jgi:peptide/nickel transport system substrate-binding protein
MTASRWWLRLTASLLLLVSACGEARDATRADGDSPVRGGTVIVAYASDLDNLNSLVTADHYTQEIARELLFLPLVRYGPDLRYEPALAERFELLGDTGAVFHLRRDVRWHDGVTTTAADVIFTYRRATDPATAFPSRSYFAHWTGAEALDSFTVRFRFEPHLEPLGGLPFLPVMPAHHLDSIPPERLRQAAFNKRPVGNGPFRFVEYRAGDRWVFEANPDFPEGLGGRPWIDRLVWRPVPDQTAQVTALATGTADLVLAPPADQYASLLEQHGLRGLERPGRQFANIIWNGRRAPLNDPRVRRALTMAVDRQQIIQTLRAGHGTLAVGPVGPYHWAYDASLDPIPFDSAAARHLLREAGIEDRNGDGLLQLPDGQPFRIELKIPAGSAMNRDMAEMIRANLAGIGVRITTRPTDWSVFVQDITSPDRNFDAVLVAWGSDFRINLRDVYHSGAMGTPNQFASYSNPRVDALIDRVDMTRSRDDATPVYAEIQRILRDDQPWSYLYYYPDLVLMRDRLRGVHMDVRGAFINVGEWWVTDPRAPAAAPEPGDSADHSPDPAPEPGQ